MEQDQLSKLPMVRVCIICLNVNNGEWAKMSPGVTPHVKEEMAIIKERVDMERKSKQHVAFGDGYCNYHSVAMYKSYGMDTANLPKSDIPCLVENTTEAENLRKNYMNGIFTEDMAKQASQQVQQSNQQLTERFKKLAGIK